MRNDVMWAVQGGPIVGDIKHGKRYDSGNITDEQYAADMAAVNTQLEELTMSINSFSASPMFCIKGQTVNVTLSWNVRGAYESLYINDVKYTGTGTSTVIQNVSAATEFTASVVGKHGAARFSKTKVQFSNYLYWGASSASAITENVVEALTNKMSSLTRIGEMEIEANNSYLLIAYPKSMGLSEISCGGIEGGFSDPQIISVTNEHGFTEDYYAYKSANKVTGTFNITLK